MNGRGRDDGERSRQLMMAALDGELSGTERNDLERLLADSPELREEWARLQRVKEVTTTMALKRPPEEVWDHYWTSVYNRAERGLGWILVSIGAMVLISFGLWEFVQSIMAESNMPGFVKIAVFALLVGLVVLAFSVIREKLFTRRRDPYKEVER